MLGRFTTFLILIGIVLMSGTYKGSQVAQDPLLGVGLLVTGVALKGGLWYFGD